MDKNQLLVVISGLSQEFGHETYVRGGGGNTSCKTENDLYIKPSGITLMEMVPEKFLGLDRKKLHGLFDAAFPADVNAREKAVVEFVAGTVLPGHSGRPSVEAPLHNCFPQTYVVHTHPALVNGLACGKNGAEICARLFPGAMWLPVIEPGYTIGMKVYQEMAKYTEKHGRAPSILFLANHGIFIAGDSAEEIRALYRDVMEKLGAEVTKAGLSGEEKPGPDPDRTKAEKVARDLRQFMGDDAACWSVRGRFPIYEGALTPDHIVYCRAVMYDGDGSKESLAAYRDKYGFWPKVVGLPDMILGFGANQRSADLASELAYDAANVVRYAGAFGGVRFLDQAFVDFIQNWEVESYRQKAVK